MDISQAVISDSCDRVATGEGWTGSLSNSVIRCVNNIINDIVTVSENVTVSL